MLQNSLGQSVANKVKEDLDKLEEHTARIKAKIESGNAIDKSIIDREAIKELNHKEAHSKAKVVKAIEHKIIVDRLISMRDKYLVVIIDISAYINMESFIEVFKALGTQAHLYLICTNHQLPLALLGLPEAEDIQVIAHTFKYSSKSFNPRVGYKEHLEFILYVNKGNKPVNHLLPNVIESTYAKDSRNLGFYTNLLLRSANAGDTILGINITNGNLIKAAQAMLCSTVIIPADSTASRECEKTIKELQFK